MAGDRASHGIIYAAASLLLLFVATLPVYWLLVVTGAPWALCYWVMSFMISAGVYLALCLYREHAIELGPFFTLTLCFATAMTALYVLFNGTGSLTG